MGLEQRGESPLGKPSETSHPDRFIGRLHWFVQPFSPIYTRARQIGTRLALAAFAIASPLFVTPLANAEGQPGDKSQGIEAAGVQADPPAGEDTFSPDQPNNQPRIEFVDGVPTVYVPQGRVEVAGAQAGGESSVDADSDQGGAGPASPDAETSAAEYRSSNGNLIIKKDTGIYPAFSDALDAIANTYKGSNIRWTFVLDPSLQRDFDVAAVRRGEPVDRTIKYANTCLNVVNDNTLWNAKNCDDPNTRFFESKPVQVGPNDWELRVMWFDTPEPVGNDVLQTFKWYLNRSHVGSRISLAVTPDDINSDEARQIKMALEDLMGLDATPPGKIP